MSTDLSVIQIKKGSGKRYSIIWLHGLGASGHDFVNIPDMLTLPENIAIDFIFPHGPIRPVTLNQGIEMPAWYDIMGLDLESREDLAGIEISAEQIRKIIARQNSAGIQTDHIFLAGFSQGGAMALYTGLTHPCRLAGILALSCYLPAQNTVNKQRSIASAKTPILQIHGQYDQIVKPEWGQTAQSLLNQWQERYEYKVLPIEHEVSLEEIYLINQWINLVLGDL